MEQDCAFSAKHCSDGPHCCASATFGHGRYPNGKGHRQLTVQSLASGLQAKLTPDKKSPTNNPDVDAVSCSSLRKSTAMLPIQQAAESVA